MEQGVITGQLQVVASIYVLTYGTIKDGDIVSAFEQKILKGVFPSEQEAKSYAAKLVCGDDNVLLWNALDFEVDGWKIIWRGLHRDYYFSNIFFDIYHRSQTVMLTAKPVGNSSIEIFMPTQVHTE